MVDPIDSSLFPTPYSAEHVEYQLHSSSASFQKCRQQPDIEPGTSGTQFHRIAYIAATHGTDYCFNNLRVQLKRDRFRFILDLKQQKAIITAGLNGKMLSK